MLRIGEDAGNAAIRCLSVEEIEPPVIALHEAARRVLELVLPQQRETQLAADPIRRQVGDCWKGVDEPVLLFRPRYGDDLGGRLPGDPASLELREHGPASLVDCLALPVFLPVPD